MSLEMWGIDLECAKCNALVETSAAGVVCNKHCESRGGGG